MRTDAGHPLPDLTQQSRVSCNYIQAPEKHTPGSLEVVSRSNDFRSFKDFQTWEALAHFVVNRAGTATTLQGQNCSGAR